MSNQLNPFASPQSTPTPAHEAWAAEHPEALRRVKLGLTLVYAGICGIMLAALAMPFTFMTLGPVGQGGEAAVLLIVIVFLLLSLLMFAGMVLCVSAPEESGVKKLAFAAVALQALSFAISGVASLPAIIGVQWVPPSVAGIVAIGGNLSSVASLVCFVLFLRGMAMYIARPDVAGRATRTLVIGGIATALVFVGTLLGGAQPEQPPTVGIPLLFFGIGGILSLVALVMYANTVTYLRKAITV